MNPLAYPRSLAPGLRVTVAALLACLLALTALSAAPAGAAAAPTSASRFYISGAGFGHGIGMSQYGAAGFAQHGFTYQQILQHYYATTTIGAVNPNRNVTVLLHEGAATFRGGLHVKGTAVTLNPRTNYGVVTVGSMLRIISHGRTIGTFEPPLRVTGNGGPLTLVGQGRYLGAFVFRPASTGGVMTVNAVGLDNYVRGVVAAEMPASWPAQALDAQAVAARTYAITAGAVAADFDVYDDTRSQMYEGVNAETPTTNAAVAATSGQVVEYDGTPVVTYFFASSGGYTESVQNVWYAIAPEAWLQGQPDPYDDSFNNPYYRWTDPYRVGTAAARLRKYYLGTFEGLNITQTGVSPRVVQAQVVGSGGSRTVTGAQLQQAFSTLSTYMSFATLTETGAQSSTPVQASTAPTVAPAPDPMPAPTPTQPTTTTSPTTSQTTTTPSPPQTGGSGLVGAVAAARAASATSTTATATTMTTATATATATTTTATVPGATTTKATVPGATTTKATVPGATTTAATATTATGYLSIRGTVYPVRQGATVVAQLDEAGGWTNVASAQVTAAGTYVIPVPSVGTYRVAYNGINGPNISVP
jgi:stage II sporulation protein D